MTDSHQSTRRPLRDIDASLHELCEAVAEGETTEVTPAEDPVVALRRVRAQIDAAVVAHRRRTDDTTLPAAGSCLLQWDPLDTPPRRLSLEPTDTGDRWTRRELEWTGSGWRVCRRDWIDDVAIRAPAEPRYPDPVDPPTIETLVGRIRDTWTYPDPLALVFDSTSTTEQGVIVAVDEQLRYRERDSDQWQTATERGLVHHLAQQGQPTLQPLSETPLTRKQFLPSPLSR